MATLRPRCEFLHIRRTDLLLSRTGLLDIEGSSSNELSGEHTNSDELRSDDQDCYLTDRVQVYHVKQ